LFVTDRRPVAFVLSRFTLLAGIQLVVADIGRKQVYLLGMALVATYFVGYFAWHLSGHGGFLSGRELLYHGMHPVQAVITHLGSSPVAALSKLAEGMLFLVLATLYRRDSEPETA